jgi:hypothetical protein
MQRVDVAAPQEHHDDAWRTLQQEIDAVSEKTR